MELGAELQAILQELSASGPTEVRENGNPIGLLSGLSWEVRGSSEKPLLHLWSENYNLTRRVLGITDHSEQRLALAVERFGRMKPDRLEFVCMEFERSTSELNRQAFCSQLKRILAEQFPDESLESLTVSADLEHSLSGSYARGLLRRGSMQTAVLAVSPEESPATIENSVTYALLWFEKVRVTARKIPVRAIRLIVPKGSAEGIAQRCRALNAELSFELYELDFASETLTGFDRMSLGNLSTSLVPHRESERLVELAQATLKPILDASPKGVTIRPVVRSKEIWLHFRGLPFVRWADRRVFFGAGDVREELTPKTKPAFDKLLHDLSIYRNPLASDTRHPLYRAQSERWLESLVQEDVTRIDASLDPRFVYPQVFANSGERHGILDLLTVTRSGRLAIIELKAAEHIHLPLQAADYWLPACHHLAQGDFARYGYFPGITLQTTLPLVYLVAPALRFHPATDTLLRFLTPRMEVVRVGLAESWRRGLRVVLRQ